ncbi:MAG TPA: ThiF family adenylyltransferase [Candidatus Paceibacterota bacterium]|jgi:molybdopterin/thiamine biosynthesis adenylyltransferase|nr:ThiF family adenylyltransferase [Candidatus Paceibacterota bacterium]
MKPERLDRTQETLEAFTGRLAPAAVMDRYDLLIEDLFLIRNPRFKFIKEYKDELAVFTQEYAAGRSHEELGEWFFFPWNKTLAHFLPEDEHQEIRTARNRNIILADEQKKLYRLKVAYAGLSVGSHGALTFALMGGAKTIHIADPDEVSASNLNRIRFDYLTLGRKKTELVREYIWQLNPYAEITSFNEGVTDETIDAFLTGVDVLVEETDNLELKIRLRLEARTRGIPVVMATDNGDNIIVETERFDLDKKLQLFNGVLGDITLEEFRSFPPQDLPKLATRIAGPDMVTERMMASLLEVGRSIYSWPQLGDAATLSGVAIAYILKRLALGQPVVNAKTEISLDAILDPDYHAPESIARREQARADFQKTIGF